MNEKQPSVVGAMSTVWFVVLSVWCFVEGYTPLWLAGVAAGIFSATVTRAVLARLKERGK